MMNKSGERLFWVHLHLQTNPGHIHFAALGAVPSPIDCYLCNRGLKTLQVRMEKMRLPSRHEMRPDSPALHAEQLRFPNQTHKEPRFA